MPGYFYRMEHGDSSVDEVDEVDEESTVTSAQVAAVFGAVDWPREIEMSNLTTGDAPTFHVEDAETGRELWVSAIGDSTEFEFTSSYTYVVRKKRWLGRGEYDTFATPDSRQDLSLSEAREALRLFLDSGHDALLALLSVV